MLKNVLIFSILIFAISCSDDNDVDVQEFSDQSITELTIETRSGPTGCYELVFPLSFILADGTAIEVESFEEAKSEFKAWKEEHPDVIGRPQLEYPVELIDEEGNVISADTKDELREIRRACRKAFVQHLGKRCFRIVYPLEILFPDNTTAEVSGPREAKKVIRAWRMDNPDAEDRPSLVFPLEVKLREDSSTVTVNSKEELKALKEECR